MSVEQAKYVLIAGNKIVQSGDDARVLISLWALHNPKTAAVVKSWRTHHWIDSDSVGEHCEGCRVTRAADGANDTEPCMLPERDGDNALEVILYRPRGVRDNCATP